MRYRELLLGRVQVGWSCEIDFSLTTAHQFTDQYFGVHEVSKTAIGALWKAWRAAQKIKRERIAKRGERAAKGWS